MCSEDQKDQAGHGAQHETEPSPDAFRRNLAIGMPLSRKSWLVARNSTLKLVRLKNCCGHPGEPGC
jgi:hypothetical protein